MQNAMTDRLYEPPAAPRREWLVTALLVLAAHVAVLALPLLAPSLELLPGHPLQATLVPGPDSLRTQASGSPAPRHALPRRPVDAAARPLPTLRETSPVTAPQASPAGSLPPAAAEASAPVPASPPENAVAPSPAPSVPQAAAVPSNAQAPSRPLETDIDIVCPRQPGAVYPPLSQRLGETGRVLVRLELDLSGRIVASSIQQSSGSSRLDRAAQAAIARYQCRPALLDGRPVPATTTQQFDFVLK